MSDNGLTDPKHYNGFSIQPLDFAILNDLPHWKGKAIKYICRAGLKAYGDMSAEEAARADAAKALTVIRRWLMLTAPSDQQADPYAHEYQNLTKSRL